MNGKKIIDLIATRIENRKLQPYDSAIISELSKLNNNEIKKIINEDEEFIKGYIIFKGYSSKQTTPINAL